MLEGTGDDDMIRALQGNDMVQGLEGDDTLSGGDADDILSCGVGSDTFDGTFALDPAVNLDDEDAADLLDGRAGDDVMVYGAGDIVTGGSGADRFIGGSSIGADNPATITDFDPAEDVLSLFISDDPGMTTDPVISVTDFTDGTGADIAMDGVVVASVEGAQGLDPAAILVGFGGPMAA